MKRLLLSFRCVNCNKESLKYCRTQTTFHLLFWGFFTLYTARFIMFTVITNTSIKKTKGPTFMELFTATGKLEKFFFDN